MVILYLVIIGSYFIVRKVGKSQGVSMFGFGNKKQDQDICCQEYDKDTEKGACQQHSSETGQQEGICNDGQSYSNELVQLKEKFIRLGADFQNYKKRVEKDRIDWMDKSKTDLLVGILPIVDNFDRALEEARHVKNEQLAEWLKGFELINKILYDFLKEQGVEPLLENEVFDPTVHEAIAQLDSSDRESGHIIDVFEKGFSHKGRVLRTAKVTVAK